MFDTSILTTAKTMLDFKMLVIMSDYVEFVLVTCI